MIWGYFSSFCWILGGLGTIFAALRASPSGRCLFCEFPTCQNCHNRRAKDKGIVPLKDKEADKDGEPIWYCGYPACQDAKPRECANTRSAACKGKLQPVTAFRTKADGHRDNICIECQHPTCGTCGQKWESDSKQILQINDKGWKAKQDGYWHCVKCR